MNAKISLPSKFDEKVKGTEFYTPLMHALERFSVILSNGDHLFREYTDHSPAHIQDVLESAEKIIQVESYELLTPEDIYTLVVSICLHDSAMTFTWDDLQALIAEQDHTSKFFSYKYGEEPSWESLWSTYKAEFGNFTESDLKNIIGDELPETVHITDHFPELGNKNLTAAQLKVAGEFVRRHHARIAHSIACCGYPNLDINDLFHSEKREYNDLAGLIARSHHHSMREMYNRLTKIQKQEHRKCHLVFLMAVLRVADLMQITSKRTPLLTFKSKKFWSSFSENEWKRHLAMLDYKEFFSDPSCIFCEIDSSIHSVKMLHSIRSLLNYFQYELDMVWANLGEAYGETPLTKLKIKYRRVSSELESPEFISELSFEDYPAQFKVDLSLIKKLITPLYGNVPEIGVRELLQNALDTSRERQHLSPSDFKKVKVSISCEQDHFEFVISDHGCGMSTQIIRDYFLSIGSSYRASKQWATEFSVEQQSLVNRSGRFGIGMLAGFILGDEIEVTTRRFDQQEGDHAIQFTFSLDSGLIQLDKIPLESTHIGTTIKIKIQQSTYERLKNAPTIWQWYYQLDKSSAEVEYVVDGVLQNTNSKTTQDIWTRIPSLEESFPNFRWGLTDEGLIRRSMLFVNNLKISSSADQGTNYKRTLDSYDQETKSWAYDIPFPPVILEDPNLKLPLNLERNGFSEDEVPFGKELYSDVISSYLEKVNDYNDDPLDLEKDKQVLQHMFFGLTKNTQANPHIQQSNLELWGLHKQGFLLSDESLIKAANVDSIYIIGQHLNSREILEKLPDNSAVFKISGGRIIDQYRSRTQVTYKEQILLSIFRSNGFLKALFGLTSQLSLHQSKYSLTIGLERCDDIDISNFVNANGLSITKSDNNVTLGYSNDIRSIDVSLQRGDYIIKIDIEGLDVLTPPSLLVKRWLQEMTSPILNRMTKRKADRH